MGDIVARVARLETTTSEMRADIAALKASAGHFPIKGDIGDVKAALGGLKDDIGELKALIASTKTRVIRWVVGTGVAGAALAFIAGRFVH
jgi:hypothetical protein